jgi:metal-responsive CopG/Arc/MetJ family transcriptional regulator
MKIAISVEDDLLQEADQFAQRMGVSRSRLFSLAVRDYLGHRRQEEMLERLNEIYGAARDDQEARATWQMKTKFRRVVQDRW